MPVSVVLPVRLRIDPDSFRADPVALREAVAVATARALARARQEVFTPRGGYAHSRFQAPQVRFAGAGAGLLDASEREMLTALVGQGIADAVQGMRAQLARDLGDLAEPLRAGKGAPHDRTRDLLGGLGYLVDSYGSDDRKPGAQAVAKLGKTKTVAPRANRREMQLAHCGPGVPELLRVGGGYLSKVVRAQFPGDYAAPHLLGVFFLNKERGGASWLCILRVRLVKGQLEWDHGKTHSQPAEFSTHDIGQEGVQALSALSFGNAQRWKKLGSASLANAGEVDTALGKAMERGNFLDQRIEALKETEAGKLTPVQQAAVDLFKRTNRRDWYRKMARDRRGSSDLGQPPFRLFQIDQGNSFFLFDATLAMEFQALNVVPLVEEGIVESKQGRAGLPGGGAPERSAERDAGEDKAAVDGTPAPGSRGSLASGQGEPGECAAYCFERPETLVLSFDGAPNSEVVTGAFECEPEVAAFGDAGKRLAAFIEEIARDLRMHSRAWPYAGAFAISAVRVLRARAALAARADSGKLDAASPAAAGMGNLGDLNAVVSASPAIAQLRALGAVAKKIEQLNLMVQAVLGPSSRLLSDCGGERFGAGWVLHYLKEYAPAADLAGYEIFVQACRVAMLQLLAASGQGLASMYGNFDEFYAAIEPLMQGTVRRLIALRRLREQILQAESYELFIMDPDIPRVPGADPATPHRGLWESAKAGADASVRVGYQAWLDARDWLAHEDTISHARTELAARDRIAGTVLRQADASFAVREKHGDTERVWTRAELESAIALFQQTAESLHPIVKHLPNLSGSVAAFESGPEATKAFVRQTLEHMQSANTQATSAVRNDVMFAFRTGKLSENWEEPTIPGTAVKLANIHAMAHEAIGDAFSGSQIYLQGVKFLFSSERGRESLMPLLELAITVGAFALFAPAGFALSTGFAGVRYDDATQHMALAEGLVDPDEVFSRFEAELELFMSHFEIAMLVLPEIGPASRRAITALRSVREQGLKAGVKTIGRQATADILEEFAVALKGGLMNAFVSQLVTGMLLEPVLEQVLGPVFAALSDEAQLGRGSPGDPAEPAPGTASTDTPEALGARMRLLADYGDVDIELDPQPLADDEP